LIGDLITAALYDTLIVSIVKEPFEPRQKPQSVHMAAAWQTESLGLQHGGANVGLKWMLFAHLETGRGALMMTKPAGLTL
jgi:hypothetical protein